ncbi:MAG: hypothetical protein A2107_15150 [Verrucomicrobia bacterium GWF2_62_7]|nr:MAG: hypothetical protein A2107_15150 [Verrucomicrobia bacterium GWF2_62_7]
MTDPAKQQRTRKIATRWLAAACGGLLAALATAASAQTNAPTVVAPATDIAPAAVSQTNVVSQIATTPADTNTVSLIDAIQADSAFQSYTNLLEHSLFVPASEIGGSSSAGDLGPSFAGGLRVTGFWVRGNVIEASLEDRNEPDKKMFVKAGDMIADTEIKVVGFDLRGRTVLLKKGDEEGRLEYESEAMPAPTAGKPGAPGMPAVPGQPQMQRPGMPPQPGIPPSSRTSVTTSRIAPQAVVASGSSDSNRQTSRREQRQQMIARLQQTLQSTPDPAAKQRLQNYIQMLEKANAQE